MAFRTRTSASLIRAAQRGSGDAAGQLFDQYWVVAVATALPIVGDECAAQDVAADSLETAFSKLSTMRGTDFAPWLRRIVVNRAISELRHREREQLVADDPHESQGEDDGPTNDPELVRAVRSLSLDRREAIFLRYWVELSPAEIAEVLDIPVGTVNSRLARGLDELRHELGVPK